MTTPESTADGGAALLPAQGDQTQPAPAANVAPIETGRATGHKDHAFPQAEPQRPSPVPVGPSRQDLYDAINGLPEKLADAVKEMLPKATRAGAQASATGKALPDAKPNGTDGVQNANLTRRQRFHKAWFGG